MKFKVGDKVTNGNAEGIVIEVTHGGVYRIWFLQELCTTYYKDDELTLVSRPVYFDKENRNMFMHRYIEETSDYDWKNAFYRLYDYVGKQLDD
jgi:hypothetical protein